MKEETKTKNELIKELKVLRAQVTKLKKSEARHQQEKQELITREEKFSNIFHNSPGAYAIIGFEDGRIVDLNDSFVQLTGYSRAELLGRTTVELKLHVEPEKLIRLRQRLNNNEVIRNVEFAYRTRNGEIRSGLYSAEVILLSGKRHILSEIYDINERKKVEVELKKTSTEISDLYNNAPCGYHSLATDGTFLRMNNTELRWLGYERAEIIGRKKFTDLITSVSQKTFQRTFPVLQKQGSMSNLELEMVRKDGTILPVLLNATTVMDETGKFVMTRSTVIDNTGLKQIRDTLIESEEKFNKAFHSSPSAMSITTIADSRLIEINESFLKISGYQRQEVIGKTVKELNLYHDYDQREYIIKCIAERGYVHDLEILTNKKNGDIRHGVFDIQTIELNGEKCLLSVITDVTESKKAEETIRRNEERFRSFFENAVEGIFQSTPEGRFVSVNNSMARMCGFESPAEMVASITDIANQYFVIPEVRKQVSKKMEEQGLVENIEYQVYRKDGTKIWMLVNARAVRNNEGKVIYYEGTTQDITFRKEAEEERRRLEELLRRSEKMEAMGKLAGGVAHDLNNVLGVLVGYSELMLIEIPEGHHLRRHVSNIMQSGERAAAIIQDLLTLARRGVQVSDVVNLNSIISSYLNTPEFELLKSHYPQVVFRTDLAEDLLNIKGSSVHLSKTIMNLVANAAEAIAGGGEVTVRTANHYFDQTISGYENMKEGDYVLLKVTDSGRGISPKDVGKIFEPFYTTKVMGRSGTGLGLAVVWGTVKDHNGHIDVQSKEGAGSSFSLYFPVTRDKKLADRMHTSPDTYKGRGESILVVDDIKEQRELAANILSGLGYKTDVVSCGEEAVAYVKANKPDLIVLDMIMDPGIDGLETYQRICDIRHNQKAIIVSGFSETDRVRKAQELGAGTYVRKPYIMEKIGMAVRQELDETD